MRNNKGYTLVELSIILLIVTIMALGAIPSVNTMVMKQTLKGTARNLVSDLRAAQQQAISSETPVTVFFNTAGGTYSTSTGVFKKLPPKVRLVSTGVAGDVFSYTSLGLPVDNPADQNPVSLSLLLEETGGQQISVLVNTAGKVTVSSNS